VAHVWERQSYYLGCVHAIVRHWHASGKPKLSAAHECYQWVGTLDWIVQHAFDLPPLMDGHEQVVERAANPALTWLRQIAAVVLARGLSGKSLRAIALAELQLQQQDVEPPAAAKGVVEEDKLARILGSTMAAAFRDEEGNAVDRVAVDGYVVLRSRLREYDARRHENIPVTRYRFVREGADEATLVQEQQDEGLAERSLEREL